MKKATLFLLVVVVLLLSGCVNTKPVNTKPVADAGACQAVVIKQTVQLDGSGSSDADGDPLTYDWVIASVPRGSRASLSDMTIVNPTFTPDVAGEYTIQLVVNDGVENSDADRIMVVAEIPNNTNSFNVFSYSFLPGSTIKLASGGSYWIRMSIGFEGDNGYNEAVDDYENISLSVTLNGNELELYESTRIEYNHLVNFWEINGYYYTGVLEKGTYEIVGTSYRGGNYVGSAKFFIIAG